MAEEPGWVEELVVERRPAGTHRPTSTSDPRFDRGMALDADNKLQTLSEIRTATDEDLIEKLGYDPYWVQRTAEEQEKKGDTVENLLATVELAANLTVLYLEHVHPHVQRWRAEAKVRRASKLPGRRYAEVGPAAHPEREAAVAIPVEPAARVAVPGEQVIMTREQLAQTLMFTLAAQRWADQGKDLLARATVVDDPLTPQLRTAMNLALAGRADELDTETNALLAAFFREAGVLGPDGKLVAAIPTALQAQAADA